MPMGQESLRTRAKCYFDTFTQRRIIISQNVGTLVTTIQTHFETAMSTLAFLTRVCQLASEPVLVLW